MDADDHGYGRDDIHVEVQAGKAEGNDSGGDPLDGVDAVKGTVEGGILRQFRKAPGLPNEPESGEQKNGQSGTHSGCQLDGKRLAYVESERDPDGSEAGEEDCAS